MEKIMRELPVFANPNNLTPPPTQFEPETEPDDALDYLRSVYRNPLEPTPVRMKAAAIAIEYERPRLAVIASIDGNDFAARLERAIARSGKVIDGPAKPQLDHKPAPMVPDRRFRRA
jgi:hypothetical protein